MVVSLLKAHFKALAIDELKVKDAGEWTARRIDDGQSDDIALRTAAIATQYVSLCRQRKFDEAMERFFSRDHVHVESPDMSGPPAEMRGIDSLKNNSREFSGDRNVHSIEVDGPYIAGDRFAVRFSIDTTSKPTGERRLVEKMDLYTVQHGKVVRSEVYYNAPP